MISAKEIESRKMSREYDPGLSGLRLVRDILLSLFQLRIISIRTWMIVDGQVV